MKTYSRVYAAINLDKMEYNMEQMHANIDPETKMIGVIKTDGYGHGAVQIAKIMDAMDYVWGYAVATLEEARQLQKAGIRKPSLVLGCVFPDQYEEMLEYNIRVNVYTEEMANAISEQACKKGLTAHVHIKLDTGMSRLGFAPGGESVEAITRISKLPGIEMEGIFTHFAKADELSKGYTEEQLLDYHHMIKCLEDNDVTFTYKHCSNSAGIIDVPAANENLVRAGISIYGLYPSNEVNKNQVDLKPMLELKSQVTMVKEIAPGTPVSYGGTFVSDKIMKIATIPVGYGDGYPRSLSNKGYVLIHGERAKILGRVCMDQFMVDVTDISNVAFGDEVTLIGNDGEAELTVGELSDLSGRFNYEFVCDLGKRIPRVFFYHGRKIGTQDYFD